MDVVKGIIDEDEGHGVKLMSGVLDRDNVSNSRDNVLRAVQQREALSEAGLFDLGHQGDVVQH